MRNKVLPPKLSIKEAIDYLEIDLFNSPQLRLCSFINNGDFKMYLSSGEIVGAVTYTKGSLIDDIQPEYQVSCVYKNGSKISIDKTLTEQDFELARDELIKYRKFNICADTLPVEPTIMDQPTPSYLDPASPFYAAEIDLAIQLHKAIQLDGYGNEHVNMEDKVNKWFDEFRPKEAQSGAKIRRLSTIIKINKK